MLLIRRGKEPDSLQKHRCWPDADFDNLPSEAKAELKQVLLVQQGYVCAYCMSRIGAENMKVEHIKSRKEHPDLQLAFTNLAACCMGGAGSPPHRQYCDSSKGENSLPFEIDENLVDSLTYSIDGKISSTRQSVDSALNGMLNLNLEMLRNNRKAVLAAVRKALGMLPENPGPNAVKKLLNNWKEPRPDGKIQAYAGVALYFLNKRLRQCR